MVPDVADSLRLRRARSASSPGPAADAGNEQVATGQARELGAGRLAGRGRAPGGRRSARACRRRRGRAPSRSGASRSGAEQIRRHAEQDTSVSWALRPGRRAARDRPRGGLLQRALRRRRRDRSSCRCSSSCSASTRWATGTSLAAIGITALFGMAAFGLLGEVSWSDAALIGLPAMLGTFVGTGRSRRCRLASSPCSSASCSSPSRSGSSSE